MTTTTPPNITRFDKKTVGRIGDMIWSMIQAFARTQGLGVKRENGKFSANEYTFGFTFRLLTEAGAPAEFGSLARALGLPADCWGKTFVATGSMVAYKIIDIQLKNRKYPVICERVDNQKRYKLSPDQINTSTLS